MVTVFLERIGLALITLVIIAVVVFFALELMPGDACTVHLGRGATDSMLEACRTRMGLDQPPLWRIWAYRCSANVRLAKSSAGGCATR